MRVPNDWDYNWHHIAGIYDGKEIKLLIDGEITATERFLGNINRCHFPVGSVDNIIRPIFSQIVRIQKERCHIVVKNGPYRYVRHPGYLGTLLFEL